MTIPSDINALVDAATTGDRRALARLLTRVEDGDAQTRPVVADLFRKGSSAVVGFTGPPGAGKSTLVDQLVTLARADGVAPIAVVAVDPSSPFTGGAILGDRVRMHSHAGDPDVYIRSMATRGSLGGLAAATPKVVAVLTGLGFGEVIVETVGVGQAEVDIAATATTTVVVLPPAFGDAVQASKAGLLEVGDVFVINQADMPGTNDAVRRLQEMLQLGASTDWSAPVVTTVATDGKGVAELRDAIEDHRRYLGESAPGTDRGAARALLDSALQAEFARAARDLLDGADAARLIDEIQSRSIDPWTAASDLTSNDG